MCEVGRLAAAAEVVPLYGRIRPVSGVLQKGGCLSGLISLEGGGLACLRSNWVVVLVFSFVLSQLITYTKQTKLKGIQGLGCVGRPCVAGLTMMLEKEKEKAILQWGER